MPPAFIVVETARQHTKEMWEGALFTRWQSSVGRVWWMPVPPSNRRLGLVNSRFEQGRYLGLMDGSNTVLVGTASGVVKARTIKRLPSGERWTGSLFQLPLVPEFRQVRRAPLRRTDFEQFGYTNNCPGCANARAGRQQPVDHSEQCRSRMEAILMTTTEGHERVERARDRFAQAAKETGGGRASAQETSP